MRPFRFQAKVSKWGTSYCIIIPHTTAKMMIGESKEDVHHKLVRVEVSL